MWVLKRTVTMRCENWENNHSFTLKNCAYLELEEDNDKDLFAMKHIYNKWLLQ